MKQTGLFSVCLVNISRYSRVVSSNSFPSRYSLYSFITSLPPKFRHRSLQIAATNNIPTSELIGFGSEAEANVYLKQNPNTTQMLAHFILDYGCNSLQDYQAEICTGAK